MIFSSQVQIPESMMGRYIPIIALCYVPSVMKGKRGVGLPLRLSRNTIQIDPSLLQV